MLTKSKVHRRILLSLAFFLALFLLSLSWFWFSCRGYAGEAIQGKGLVNVPKLSTEAIVVLAGDSNRISSALELLRERGGERLLISGADPSVPLLEIINRQGTAAVDIHETWKKIVLESESRSTIENAKYAKRSLKKYAVQRIILVTSDYHMHRAAKIFRANFRGIELVEYPVMSEFSELSTPGIRKFFKEYWKHLLYSVGLLR